MHRRLVCLALSIVTAAACGDGTSPTPDAATVAPTPMTNASAAIARETLRAQRGRFVEPVSYSFTETVSGCYCTGGAYRVSVVGGVVTRVIDEDSHAPVSDEDRASYKTMSQQLDFVERQVSTDGDWGYTTQFTVELDPALAYLARFKRTVYEITDSDLELRFTDFVTPADAP